MSVSSKYEHIIEAATTLAQTFLEPIGGSPAPSDSTHRYYLCKQSIDSRDVMYCRSVTAESAHSVGIHHEVVTVKRACPEMFDQLVLSSKLKKPVAMG